MKYSTATVLSVIIITLLFTAGCVTTDDPRKGGLFSYNKDVYEKRLEKRQRELELLEDEQKKEAEKTQQLLMETAEKEEKVHLLEEQSKALYNEISLLERMISQVDIQTGEKEEKRSRIAARLEKIKQDLKTTEQDSTISIQKKKEQLESLNTKIDLLLEEAEALSQL